MLDSSSIMGKLRLAVTSSLCEKIDLWSISFISSITMLQEKSLKQEELCYLLEVF